VETVDVKMRAKRAVLRVFPRAGDVKRRLQARGAGEHVDLHAQVRTLSQRVSELESEMQEARRLNTRIAELTDVVAEVLLPVDQRDEAAVRAALSRYTDTL
jgi:signal transduction histidine kinase